LQLSHKADPIYVPRNETARPRSQFSQSYICEKFIHSHDLSTYFAAAK
jgi:hypothetical protein